MLCCDQCNKWAHRGCEGMTTEEYNKLIVTDDNWYVHNTLPKHNTNIANISITPLKHNAIIVIKSIAPSWRSTA
jgi:hypothetical protein